MVSAKRMEELLGIGPIHKERIVPETRLVEGREFCYVSNRNQEKFGIRQFWKRRWRILQMRTPVLWETFWF